MCESERRQTIDRRRVPRGGRRATDRPGRYPPILVADPYDGARQPCARYLASYHFDVREAASGEEVLERIVAAPPSVILAEWDLPAMPAPRLYQWLGQNWRTRNIPLIVMVGTYEGNPTMPPVAGILVKPFPLATMLDELRRVLRSTPTP